MFIKHSDGVNVIGGTVQYAVNVTGGGRVGGQWAPASIKPDSVYWTISGLTGEYQGEDPPDPSQGQTSWKSDYYPSYNLTSQKNPSIQFNWGFLPGKENFEATVTIQVTIGNKVYTTGATPKGTAYVGSPGWEGSVVALKSASYCKGYLAYGAPSITPQGALIYTRAGINWGGLEPRFPGTIDSGNWGTFRVVQILNSYSTQVSIPGENGELLKGYYRKNAQGAPYRLTPPGLDVAGLPTDPFYVAPGPPGVARDADIPRQQGPNGSTISLSLTFTDYVMFLSQTGGMYVPMGYFQWKISAIAAPNPNGKPNGNPRPYKVTTIDAGLFTKPTISHASWPGSWNFVGGSGPRDLEPQP